MNKKLLLYITLVIAMVRILFIRIPDPLPLYYGWFGAIALLSFIQHPRFNGTMLLFLLACALSLLFNDVNQLFKPWQRFVSFTIMVAAIGPINTSFTSSAFKYELLKKINVVLVYGVVISFIGYLVRFPMFHSASGFNGFTNHSMTLSSVSGLATLVCFHRYMIAVTKKQRRIYLAMSVMCVLSCLLGGSRGALLALMAGFIFYLRIFFKNQTSKFVKYILAFIAIAVVSAPFWIPYTANIMEKVEQNRELGGMTASRDALWNNRITEFKQSPIFGVGFASVDTTVAANDFDPDGTIEPGSSWLFMLSSIGLFGTCIFAVLFFRPVFRLYFAGRSYAPEVILIVSLLIFRGVHMFAEGYALASGDFGFLYLWLCLAVANNITQTKPHPLYD